MTECVDLLGKTLTHNDTVVVRSFNKHIGIGTCSMIFDDGWVQVKLNTYPYWTVLHGSNTVKIEDKNGQR